jgi:hypothetical protein
MLFPSLEAAGRESRPAPVNMIKAKLDTMILVGDTVFSGFFLGLVICMDRSFFVINVCYYYLGENHHLF